jgi:extracellular factor (EF) 3-hydroxypalmitic acid methyl ester biosynthesis protein
VAHRNRIDMLLRRIEEEAKRVAREGRPLKLLNIGCGPALELQRFLATSDLSRGAEFTLMDFNLETLGVAREKLEAAQREGGRRAEIEYLHQSIHGLLKEALQRESSPAGGHDLIYCAGLFDYLSDRICRRLLSLFLHWTNPGGLVLATNVHPSNPARHYMEHILEWYLIHRDENAMVRLAPKDARCEIDRDATGVNVFLRLRKDP